MSKHSNSPSTSDNLQALFDYQPQPLRGPNDLGRAASPLDFYDLHLHQDFQLQHVVLFPDLLSGLASRVDQVRLDLESQGYSTAQPMGLIDPEDRMQLSNHNAFAGPHSIARFYAQTTARSCLPLAAQWVIHPKWQRGGLVIKFLQAMDLRLPDHDFISDMWSLRLSQVTGLSAEVYNSMDSDTILNIRTLQGKPLATWIFMPLCPEAKSVLEDMGDLASDFELLLPTTTGHPHLQRKGKVSATPPPDSPRPIFTLPRANSVSEDGTAMPSGEESVIRPQGSEVNAPLQRTERTPSADDLLQHAWTHAVRYDTTFIIINAGNYERIAIRHRGSQTIYLSDLIDISNDANPAYGKIQAGLYLSIVQDAFDRIQHTRDRPSTALGKRKRKPRLTTVIRKSARQEVQTMKSRMVTPRVSDSQDEAIWRMLDDKILALVYLDDGVFGSTIPASCARVRPSLSKYGTGMEYPRRRGEFSYSEALRIELGPCFATGGTGALHHATVHLNLSTKQTNAQHPSCIEVIAKLAITSQNRLHLHHEYAMYERLWEHNVRGILPVYGLFEDHQGVTSMLILGKGGIALYQREHGLSDYDRKVSVTPKERDMFMGILEDIHRAGIYHGDIHPGNFLIDEAGQGHIIDFGHSTLEDSEANVEMDCLSKMFDGEEFRISPPPFSCTTVGSLL